MSNGFPRTGLLAAFAVLIGIVVAVIILKPATVEIRSGTLLKTPRPVVDFTLENAAGGAFTKADLAGRWTVIFPGFTFCPDVCPTTLTTLKAVQQKLGEDAAKVQIVMLSVDPERDVPQKLGAYVHAFSSSFVGITGRPAELDRLGESLGYAYTKVAGATPESYTIDHSASLIVIGPQAQLLGYFTPPYKVDSLVADLKALTAGTARAS